MAVVDHPVLEKNRIHKDSKYGCWNKDRQPGGYWAKNGLEIDEATGTARYRMVFIKNTLSPECRYDGAAAKAGQLDSRCDGCKHFLVSGYVQNMIEKAAAEAVAA